MILTISKTLPARIALSGHFHSKLYLYVKDFIGYGLCSAAALAIDCGLLFGLTHAGVNYLPAAAIGFFSGMMLAYYMSVRFVYADRRGPDAKWEAIGFFAIGLAGLLLNQILLFALIDGLQLSLGLAKGLTATGVFLFNFTVRRSLLFAAGSLSEKGEAWPLAMR
jgi:putative flippase GtrA